MAAHFARWLQFANGALEIGLQEKELLFVSGFVKTAEWAAAAFRGGRASEAGGELAVSGGFLGLPGAAAPAGSVSAGFSVSMTRSQCESPALFYRAGPQRSAGDIRGPGEVFDQCVFLHYYKMKSRILWRTIRAAAEPRDPHYDSSNDGEPDLHTGQEEGSPGDTVIEECCEGDSDEREVRRRRFGALDLQY